MATFVDSDLPILGWVLFAAYLNAGIWWLNLDR